MKKILCLLLAAMMVLIAPVLTSLGDSIENPEPDPEIEDIIEEHQTIYRLTIYYIYLDGSTAAPTYTEQLEAGAEYSVPSPKIEGYRPTLYLVAGVMPARDMEYTVIYIPGNSDDDDDIDYFTIEDYETPLGLGASIMNIGVSVE